MSINVLIASLQIVLFLTTTHGQGKKTTNTTTKKAKFPHLTNYSSDEVDKPVFIFEGVNYDDLPPHLKEIHKDCYGDYIRCSRSMTQHHQVCAYNLEFYYFESFHSICEMMYSNCQRMNKEHTQFYYIADGYYCQHWTRRLQHRADPLKELLSKVKQWANTTSEFTKKTLKKISDFFTGILKRT